MSKGNEQKKSSRRISICGNAQMQEPQLESHAMLFKQPDPVQAIASTKMLFRNFVNEDVGKKIYQIDEMIEATSKMIRTKEDVNRNNSKELHHINKLMKQCSATTAKKAKEYENMLQTFEINRNNMTQSDNRFMELLVIADEKELELTELRDRFFGCTEKVKQLKFELEDVRNNLNRISDLDESSRKALAESKERYEHILKQNTEIEENLEKLNAESKAIADRQTEITNEINIAKEKVSEGNTTTVQNRAEIAKLKPIIEENRNAVAANHRTIEQMMQKIELAKYALVDSRVDVRFKICEIQRHNTDTKNEMEKAQQAFNALRSEIIEKIKLETESQKLFAERKQQAIEKQANTMKRKLTPTRPRSQGNDNQLIDLVDTSFSPSSSSNSVEVSFLVSKRAKKTNNISPNMQATFDSDSDSENLDL